MRSVQRWVIVTLLAVLVGHSPLLRAGEVIDAAAVIALHEAGLTPEVIVNKIVSAQTVRFQNSTEELVQLGRAGVPSAVIEALQRRASTEGAAPEATATVTETSRAYGALPQEIGVFVVIGSTIVPIAAEPVKHEFVGMGVAKGVLGLRKPRLPRYVEGGASAVACRGSRPVLLVNLPGEKLGDFKLIRALKINANSRELFRAVAGIFSAKEVESKEIAVRSTPVGEGYYELTPAENLAPGEYAVVHYGVDGGTPRAWPFRIVAGDS
jgi:hypothetical protein